MPVVCASDFKTRDGIFPPPPPSSSSILLLRTCSISSKPSIINVVSVCVDAERLLCRGFPCADARLHSRPRCAVSRVQFDDEHAPRKRSSGEALKLGRGCSERVSLLFCLSESNLPCFVRLRLWACAPQRDRPPGWWCRPRAQQSAAPHGQSQLRKGRLFAARRPTHSLAAGGAFLHCQICCWEGSR